MSTDITPSADSADNGWDIYELLSRPTLDLTDADLERIVADLRQKRAAFVADSKKGADKPPAKRTAGSSRASADEKRRNTQALLAGLNLKLPGKGA